MTMPADEQDIRVMLGVLTSQVADTREDIKTLRVDIANSRADVVARGEWQMRNNLVDTRFERHGSEISEIKSTIAAQKSFVESRRAPWSTWAALLISVAAVIVTVYQSVPH